MGYMWDIINQVKSSFCTHSSNVVSHSPTGGRRFNRLSSRLHFLRQQSKIGLRDTKSRFKAYTSALAVFTLAFAISFLAASTLSSPNNTSAEGNEDTSTATAGDYNLSVSATKGVSLPLSVSENDTMTVSEGYVSVKTNSPGYRLYISMTGDSTNLTNVKDHLSGAIAATTGTIGDPAVLTRGTWGYAIPSGTAHLVSNNFSSSYSTTTSTSPDETKKFATPPSGNSNPSLLATSASSTSESGDSYPVYYAIRANANTAPGEYSGSIMYTALADAGTTSGMTVTPNSIAANTTTTVTLTSTIYSTDPNLGGTISLTGTGTTTDPTCTKTSGTPLTYSCELPALSTGMYSIRLSVPKYASTPSYTAILTVTNPTYIVNITNSNTTSNPASSVSVPLNGSATVTVTPDSGYYLSDVSCPSGYTCTGYSTDTSATETQTVTITNNNTQAGGTLAFTGTKSDDITTITNMQQMTSAICANSSIDDTATLTDTRDYKTYTIRKLKDGNCWMTENLRLTGQKTLTSADSNVSADFNLPATNSSFPATCVNTAYNMYSGGTMYGSYYNWYAATAGTGTCTMTSGNAPSSICPKGWRLPIGGDSGEFQALYSEYPSYALMRADPAFTLSGNRNGSTTNNRGSTGYYWSSTAYSNASAYSLLMNSSNVNPANHSGTQIGFAVKCVAQ